MDLRRVGSLGIPACTKPGGNKRRPLLTHKSARGGGVLFGTLGLNHRCIYIYLHIHIILKKYLAGETKNFITLIEVVIDGRCLSENHKWLLTTVTKNLLVNYVDAHIQPMYYNVNFFPLL